MKYWITRSARVEMINRQHMHKHGYLLENQIIMKAKTLHNIDICDISQTQMLAFVVKG